ncbi:MAG: cytochrome c biogenesis protein ResB [bacterium]|nr:cytochrome c biogenesis protein ResB [bacterium]
MKRLVGFCASPRAAALLLGCIAAVSAYGSLIPHRRAAAVFGSRAFAALCVLLFLHILAGGIASLRRGRREPWFALLRLGALLVLAGAFLGGAAGARGRAQLYPGRETASFTDARGGALEPGFTLRLDRFTVERHPGGRLELGISVPGEEGMALHPVRLGEWTGPDAMRVRPLRYLPDFKIGDGGEVLTKSAQPNNPALEVEVRAGGETERGWLLARFPAFPPLGLGRTLREGRVVFFDRGSERVKSYASEVTIMEGGRPAAAGRIEVNRPLSFGGYRIYQTAYDPVGWQWSGFTCVRDPGLPLVYSGFVLLALGVTLWAGAGEFGP